jgi:hypothetical protein
VNHSLKCPLLQDNLGLVNKQNCLPVFSIHEDLLEGLFPLLVTCDSAQVDLEQGPLGEFRENFSRELERWLAAAVMLKYTGVG